MCDFLPESVHTILNDVETSMSLPALAIIVLCTAQFAVYHGMHIACTLKEIMRKKLCCEKKRRPRKCVKQGPGLLERLTDFMYKMIGRSRVKCLEKRKTCKKPRPACKRSGCPDAEQKAIEDDWDDINDDDDDDLDDP